jgi:hypothetical protein
VDICIGLVVASTVLLGVAAPVTLAWEHSVERFGIQEQWHATPAGLVLTEVRTQGLGAGVHVPPDARLVDGWWRFKPPIAPQARVTLARSRFAAGYRLCKGGQCEKLADLLPQAVDRALELAPCAATMPACSSSNCWPPRAGHGAADSR